LLFVGAVGIALVAVGIWWFAPRPANNPPEENNDLPDPRLTYDGPFENVHPSINYINDEKCADCHVSIARTYAQHPMGRSAVPIRELAGKQFYDAKHRNPFDAKGVRLWVDAIGDRVWHRHAPIEDGNPIWEVRQEVHHVIGSGTRGYSYLAEVDGYLFQTAISWFSQKELWDISPGFGMVPTPGRPIHTACLHCHTNRVKEVPGYLRRYEPGVFDGHAIGCQRCHGPGEKHVQFRESGEINPHEIDRTIVNPAHLPWQLRENVCEQCHVSGETRITRRGRGWFDYRPGTRLEDFLAIFVKNPDLPSVHKAVSHVEQMRKSACFQKTDGKKKLGCISCHDPHQRVDPALRTAYYRQRCLNCHEEKSCSVPVAERLRKSPGDSCYSCHMPQAPAADIAHTALTDHSISRPGKDRLSPTRPESLDDLPVALLHRDRIDGKNIEHRRDQSVALMRLVELKKIPPHQEELVLQQIVATLDEALRKAPKDPAGWQAKGEALKMLNRREEAQQALERALEQVPNHENVLEDLAYLAQDARRYDDAIAYWKRVVEVNPHKSSYRDALARLLASRGDWIATREQAQGWLKLEPGSVIAWQLSIRSLLEQGKREEARKEFEQLRKLKPRNIAELEAYFRKRGG
jgi:predicted CXXCH cytochrome family protein